VQGSVRIITKAARLNPLQAIFFFLKRGIFWFFLEQAGLKSKNPAVLSRDTPSTKRPELLAV
jgi:hypothetical protein